MFTLDASVCTRILDATEIGFDECERLFALLQSGGRQVIVPTLVLVEVAAAVSRSRRDPIRARVLVDQLRAIPSFAFVALDGSPTRRAADIAADYRLRGADAVYAAVAQQFGTTLITFANEQQVRIAAVIQAITPSEAIFALETGE